eukprot:scaffold71669_cov27-Phaeocystis_antarctica.AAC.1
MPSASAHSISDQFQAVVSAASRTPRSVLMPVSPNQPAPRADREADLGVVRRRVAHRHEDDAADRVEDGGRQAGYAAVACATASG